MITTSDHNFYCQNSIYKHLCLTTHPSVNWCEIFEQHIGPLPQQSIRIILSVFALRHKPKSYFSLTAMHQNTGINLSTQCVMDYNYNNVLPSPPRVHPHIAFTTYILTKSTCIVVINYDQ
jgi:hypothetical protein